MARFQGNEEQGMSASQGGRAKKGTRSAPARPAVVAGSPDSPSSLKLQPHCTLREAAALKTQLLEQLELGRDVILDGGAVEKIDTAGLQLLAAFSRHLGECGRHLEWTAVTPELLRAGAQLDLAELIGLNTAPAVLQ
jgi:anti-anti-sigma regulatory factor